MKEKCNNNNNKTSNKKCNITYNHNMIRKLSIKETKTSKDIAYQYGLLDEQFVENHVY